MVFLILVFFILPFGMSKVLENIWEKTGNLNGSIASFLNQQLGPIEIAQYDQPTLTFKLLEDQSQASKSVTIIIITKVSNLKRYEKIDLKNLPMTVYFEEKNKDNLWMKQEELNSKKLLVNISYADGRLSLGSMEGNFRLILSKGEKYQQSTSKIQRGNFFFYDFNEKKEQILIYLVFTFASVCLFPISLCFRWNSSYYQFINRPNTPIVMQGLLFYKLFQALIWKVGSFLSILIFLFAIIPCYRIFIVIYSYFSLSQLYISTLKRLTCTLILFVVFFNLTYFHLKNVWLSILLILEFKAFHHNYLIQININQKDQQNSLKIQILNTALIIVGVEIDDIFYHNAESLYSNVTFYCLSTLIFFISYPRNQIISNYLISIQKAVNNLVEFLKEKIENRRKQLQEQDISGAQSQIKIQETEISSEVSLK